MPKKRVSGNTNPIIIVSIIGLIGTIISAILSSPILVAKFQNSLAPSLTVSSATLTGPVSTSPVSVTTVVSSSDFFIPSMEQGGIPITSPENLKNIVQSLASWKYSWKLLQMPDDINPVNDPKRSLDKTIASVQNNELHNTDIWLPVSPSLKLTLDIQNVQSTDGLEIKIVNEASVGIVDFSPSESTVNALVELGDLNTIPVTGGVYNYKLRPVLLDSLDWTNTQFHTNVEKYDSVILKPGEIGTFELELKCKTPGIYRVVVTLQMFFSGTFYSLDFDPLPNLNCPSSFSLWSYESLSAEGKIQYEWKKRGDYVFQDGNYVVDVTATPGP